MKDGKIYIYIMFLISMLYMVPPLFTRGGIFNVQYMGWEEGEYKLLDGLYFPCAFFTILYALLTLIGIGLPLVKKLNKLTKLGLNLLGGWSAAALGFELVNWTRPLNTLNDSLDNKLYVQFLLAFIFILLFNMITWRQKQPSK